MPKNHPVAHWLGVSFRARGAECMIWESAALALPAQVVELADDEEDQTQPRQEGDETQGAPDIGLGGRAVSRDGLVRPVVGVGVILPGAIRRCGPGRPGEVGGQSFDLRGVLNIVGRQPGSGVLPGEVLAPFGKLGAVGSHLARREPKSSRGRIVPVFLERRDRPRGCDALLVRRELRKGLAVFLGRDRVPGHLAEPVQILRAVIGTQVGPMAPQAPVLHETVLEEDLLALLDVGSGKHHSPVRIHEPSREWVERSCRSGP